MQILRQALNREWYIQAGICAALESGGIFLLATGFPRLVWAGLIGVALLTLGIGWMIRLLREWPVDKHPILSSLTPDSRRIVWVYWLEVNRMPFGLFVNTKCYLILKFLDGTEHSVGISSAKIRVVVNWLKRLLPHCTFGYQPRLEAMYRDNPAALLRPTDENN